MKPNQIKDNITNTKGIYLTKKKNKKRFVAINLLLDFVTVTHSNTLTSEFILCILFFPTFRAKNNEIHSQNIDIKQL